MTSNNVTRDSVQSHFYLRQGMIIYCLLLCITVWLVIPQNETISACGRSSEALVSAPRSFSFLFNLKDFSGLQQSRENLYNLTQHLKCIKALLCIQLISQDLQEISVCVLKQERRQENYYILMAFHLKNKRVKVLMIKHTTRNILLVMNMVVWF